jgi:hypothetical protein
MSRTIHVAHDATAAEMLREAGILAEADIPSHMAVFVEQAEAILEKLRDVIAVGEVEEHRGPEFQQLLIDIAARIMSHPIVAGNRYLKRFAEGVSLAQARHECRQFSIFALQFDVAQAKLVSNAPTYDAYVERLHVLLNEKGIPYKDGFEGELTGHWRMGSVHFSWMLNMGKGLGLEFEDLGKIWLALPGTKAFVDATFNNYASIDPNIAEGSAFAIENWAANYLWKPWIAGMEKLNATLPKPVDLGYLKYHNLEEEHHSQATLDELLESFTEPWFDAERFLEGAEAMLTDGVQAYYVSQLASLPEKDESWPATAFEPRSFDPEAIPRIAGEKVPA